MLKFVLSIFSFNYFFRIECTEENEDAISKAPEVTNKREPLKTPKTYFFESLQKRRQKALTKSQSACRFLANAGPNLIRRGSTIRFDLFCLINYYEQVINWLFVKPFRHLTWRLPGVFLPFYKFYKGQLISKCPFGVIVWTKISTKKFDKFCPRIWKVVKS